MNDQLNSGDRMSGLNRRRWVNVDTHDIRLLTRHNRLDDAIPGGPLKRG